MTRMATPILDRLAPAKVNLSLAVLGRRPDGFHEIESWVIPIDWCDRLALRAAERPSLEIGGAGAGVPGDRENLAWRAGEALARAAGRPFDIGLRLEKSIPAGAGLGGGSSDAAAVLLLLNRFWELNWPTERLHAVASEVGSDVPLFLRPGAAILRGRGERIERLERGWNGWLVVVIPPFALRTEAVYEGWAQAHSGGRAGPQAPMPWLEWPSDGESLMRRLFNDLEPAAFALEPRLGRLHARLDGLSGRAVRMTGSGSALFTLFDDRGEAETWKAAAAGRLDGAVELRVVSTRCFEGMGEAASGSAQRVEESGGGETTRSREADG